MLAATAALLLASAPPGCSPEDASLAPDALAERATAIAAAAAAAGPAGGLEAAARELADSAPGDRQRLAARFAAALEWHCRLAQEPRSRARIGAAERERLERILSQPRFARARLDQGLLGRWLVRAWDWLAELLGTGEAGQVASAGRTAFFAAAAAAAAWLGLRALRRRARRRGPAPPRPEVVVAPRPGEAPPEEALSRGDAAGAVRGAFLLALGAAERAGVLPPGRALTNREMAGRLRAASPGAADDFEGLAGAFDRTIYGEGRPDAGEAAAWVAAARRLAAALGGGSR